MIFKSEVIASPGLTEEEEFGAPPTCMSYSLGGLPLPILERKNTPSPSPKTRE